MSPETARKNTKPGDLERCELVCAICGYRIVLDREPDRCPMCGGEQWELVGPRPFGPDEADPPRRSLP